MNEEKKHWESFLKEKELMLNRISLEDSVQHNYFFHFAKLKRGYNPYSGVVRLISSLDMLICFLTIDTVYLEECLFSSIKRKDFKIVKYIWNLLSSEANVFFGEKEAIRSMSLKLALISGDLDILSLVMDRSLLIKLIKDNREFIHMNSLRYCFDNATINENNIGAIFTLSSRSDIKKLFSIKDVEEQRDFEACFMEALFEKDERKLKIISKKVDNSFMAAVAHYIYGYKMEYLNFYIDLFPIIKDIIVREVVMNNDYTTLKKIKIDWKELYVTPPVRLQDMLDIIN